MAPTWIMRLRRDGRVLDQRYPEGARAELRSRMVEWLALRPDATHATLHPLGEALEIGGEVERVERNERVELAEQTERSDGGDR